MDDDSTAVYEVRLQGTNSVNLQAHFPNAKVQAARPETVLRLQANRPDELDSLLMRLLSMGIVLNDVHEVTARATPAVSPAKGTGKGDDHDI